MIKSLLLLKIIFLCFLSQNSLAQHNHRTYKNFTIDKNQRRKTIKYGTASFYADKFHLHQTANGEKYNHSKYTAACNVLPLNSWIKVTNLSNHHSVILRINDRMNKNNKRLIDVSKSAAQKLGFISRGITKVKVEVLRHYNRKSASSD